MKLGLKYVSLFLVVVFLATLIPFHAFHKHLEEEHFVAINTTSEKQHHHCVLDENHCQDLLIKNCEHKQHVGNGLEKCFFSQYHFIKNIALTNNFFSIIQLFSAHYFENVKWFLLNQIPILLNNKGPPTSIILYILNY